MRETIYMAESARRPAPVRLGGTNPDPGVQPPAERTGQLTGLQMEKLTTIEAELKRKRQALRALSARLKANPAAVGGTLPNSDGARLVRLRQECESLERSKDIELLQLSSSESRSMRRGASEAATTDDLAPATPMAPPQLSLQHSSSDADLAWKSYRSAQKSRDAELRSTIKGAWAERAGEIKAARERTAPRISSHWEPSKPAGSQPPPVLTAVPVSPSVDEQVHSRRRDARALNRELQEQRSKEWAERGKQIKALRAKTSKRVDDQIEPDCLRARPLSALVQSIGRPSLPHSVSAMSPAVWRDPRSGSHRSVFDISDGEWLDHGVAPEVHYMPHGSSTAELPQTAYPATPDDPYRHPYTSQHATPRASDTSARGPLIASPSKATLQMKTVPSSPRIGTMGSKISEVGYTYPSLPSERVPGQPATYEQMRRIMREQQRSNDGKAWRP